MPRSAAAGTVKSASSGAAQSIEFVSSAIRTRPLGNGGGSGGAGALAGPAAWGPGSRRAAWRARLPLRGRRGLRRYRLFRVGDGGAD